MAKTKKLSDNQLAKREVVKEIVEKAKKAKSMVFVDYKGLTVEQVSALRVSMKKENADYKVYKNTLAARALKEIGIEVDENEFSGTLAVAFSYDDELAGARILKDMQTKSKKLAFKFGYLGVKKLDEKATIEFAAIPPREVLLSKLLFCLQSPMQKFAIAVSEIAKKQGA